MKLNQKQLRQLIEAEFKKARKLNEADAGRSDLLTAVASAIVHEIKEHLSSDVAFSNVGEITAGTVHYEEILSKGLTDTSNPDADDAETVALLVAEYIKNDVQQFAEEMLASLESNAEMV